MNVEKAQEEWITDNDGDSCKKKTVILAAVVVRGQQHLSTESQ
jgi:hypothetical protein